jgi:hypothetical protein
MTNPIKNNQAPSPANDPYAPDPYGESGYDPGMGGDDYGMDGGYEDEFVGGDMEGGQTGAPQSSYTANELRDMVKAVKDQLTPEQYASFMGRINMAAAMSPDKMEGELAKIAGDLNAAVNPASAEGAEGMEGMEGEGNEEAVEREAKKKELEDYLKAVNDNPDIPSDLKEDAKEKIEKWIKGMELGTITMETIDEELDTLKNEISDATAFAPTIQKLAQVTGKEPAELEKLFEKHGLDPKNLPNPPDAKVAELLNDPAFSDTISSLKSQVKDDYKALKDFIQTNTSNANSLNSANESSNTSQTDNLDYTSFQNLQDAFEKKDDNSKRLIENSNKLANEVANVLSAMYDTEVKAVGGADPLKAGMITFGGTEMNIIGSGATGEVGFKTGSGLDWPQVDRVAYRYDGEGDGQTPPPGWMKTSSYPSSAYDGDDEHGGATS